MQTSIKIALTAIGLIFGIIIFLFPGLFPIHALEGVFAGTCTGPLQGEYNSVRDTSFVGLGGSPIRKDYAECGVTPAYDANKICYIAPNPRPSFISTNPLGKSTPDECDLCEFGSENIKDGKFLLGKSCRPYKFIWRWKYKTSF